MRRRKGRRCRGSSNAISMSCRGPLLQGYWGQHLWARGNYCASVGAVDDRPFGSIFENQKWDEDVDGFKITAPTEPRAGAGAGPLQRLEPQPDVQSA